MRVRRRTSEWSERARRTLLDNGVRADGETERRADEHFAALAQRELFEEREQHLDRLTELSRLS